MANDAKQISQGEVLTAQGAVKTVLADVAKAKAESKRNEVLIDHARRKLDQKSILAKGGWASANDSDDARAAFDSALAESDAAQAQVASLQARVEEAKAQLAVAQSKASQSEAELRRSQAGLHVAEVDLDRSVIRAPMDGVVIDRSVTAGQTVAASFEAPTLFTIGDLRSVNVEMAVDEADIGGMRVGQNVTFSVDAYPDKTFAGRIRQVRKSPHIKDSVVTYTVVVAADNDDLLLFPGMTATANIITHETPDALQVPTAALRYHPHGIQQSSASQVWVSEGEGMRPVAVQVGASNNGMTEIVAGNLSEGEKVIIGDTAASGAVSPGLASREPGTRIAGWMKPLSAALVGLALR